MRSVMVLALRVSRFLAVALSRLSRTITQVCESKLLPSVDIDTDTTASDLHHPERLAAMEYVSGLVLEVGCGHRKSDANFVGVDLVPGGERCSTGNTKGRISQADVACSGEMLPFKSSTFDSVLARHNLEHYVHTTKVLREWMRVLKPGGLLVVIVPDEGRTDGRTVLLDPTHYTSFTEASLRDLSELIGLEVLESHVVIDRWSFIQVARKPLQMVTSR